MPHYSPSPAEREINGMAVSRRWLVRVIALMSLLLAIATAANPVGAAEEAVLIPGATVFKKINPFYPIIAKSYRNIGINLHDDDDPLVVDYSQDPLATEHALRDGVERADVAVREIDGKVVVIGESMGSMVASRLATRLADSSDPLSPNDIRFVLIASPEEGVAQYFKEGTYIPLLNYRVSRVPRSPYPTTVVIGEYDGWADPPDRPWNLISLANAALGVVYVHGPASWDVDLRDVPPENTTVDGTVTTYLVPTKNLPLTRPFRDVGIPDGWVDKADQILRPIVDAGYRRHDRPGDTRPYLSDGRIRRNVQSAQQAREQSRAEAGGDDEQSEDPGRPRQIADDDRPDQNDAEVQEAATGLDGQESESDTADRRADVG
ncbi:PE-PPE domain-containing protein [Mycobacterium sp. B14F4]|uniref:PE-PPE domain-containing protein n=1 Tax=Mycobacterium sp. B14F4 TaxID=3153565 RepID=UPI00325EA008